MRKIFYNGVIRDMTPEEEARNLSVTFHVPTTEDRLMSLESTVTNHLPNNYMKKKGVCIEDCSNPEAWIVSDTGITVSRSSEEKLLESGSIMFTFSGSNSMTKAINYDFTDINVIAVAIYIENKWTFDGFKIRLATTEHYVDAVNDWTKYFESPMAFISDGQIHSGWNYIKFHKDDFTNVGGETWGSFVALRGIAQCPAYVYNMDNSWSLSDTPNTNIIMGIGGIYLNPVFDTPKIMINFDDSVSTLYSDIFQYARGKGVVGSVFVCKDHVGNGYMTVAQHQEMYNSGWDLCNHSTTHRTMPTLSDAEVLADFGECRNFLISNGWMRGADIIAFPVNGYDARTLGLIKQLGAKMSRGFAGGRIDLIQPDSIYQFHTREIFNTTSLDTITGWIDKAIALGSSISIFGHGTMEIPDKYNTTSAIAHGMIDYIALKRDAGLIEPATLSQFYEGLNNKEIKLRTT